MLASFFLLPIYPAIFNVNFYKKVGYDLVAMSEVRASRVTAVKSIDTFHEGRVWGFNRIVFEVGPLQESSTVSPQLSYTVNHGRSGRGERINLVTVIFDVWVTPLSGGKSQHFEFRQSHSMRQAPLQIWDVGTVTLENLAIPRTGARIESIARGVLYEGIYKRGPGRGGGR